MIYTLKHFDTPLLQFSAKSGAEMNVQILSVNEDFKALLPLDLSEVTAVGLKSWLKHRSVPKNRAYIDNLLTSIGLSFNRHMDVLRVSKGLSLNDCYWITEEGCTESFAENNLYENRFSRVLGQIAFTGYGSSNLTGLTSSPEFTTNGALPKCWRRINGKIILYKGGTMGASNTGNEPYSEFYASQIGQLMGFDVIPYSISKWKGILCSTCELFTNKETSFVPIGGIVRYGGIRAVKDYCHVLGEEYEKALNDMFVFDALIFNTDRHFGNFGLLVDSHTNRIIAPAPFFDHGNSLFNFAGTDALQDKKSIMKYAKAQKPSVYDDYVAEARAVLTHEHSTSLRTLLNFRFKRHSRYNPDVKRIRLIEYAVQQRAAELLEE